MLKYVQSKQVFNTILNLSAKLSRIDIKGVLILPLMKMMGHINGKTRNIHKMETVSEMGKEWQRMFPAGKKYMPIIQSGEETVIAEIRLKCPLRDSGDVNACYRMMEYDREMVRKMGGQFVVLDSQSNNGKGYCTVAMRMKGKSMNDLQLAHLK